MLQWIRNHPYKIIIVPASVFLLITLLFQYAFFDGIHIGSVNGTVKKTYIKHYKGWRSSSRLFRAKLETDAGDTIDIICEIHCSEGARINVQIYKTLIPSKRVYRYKRVFPYPAST